MLNTVDVDVETVENFRRAIHFPVAMVGNVVGLWAISPRIALMVPLGGTVVAAAAWLTAKPFTKVSGRRRQAEADDASLDTDVVQGSRVVKGGLAPWRSLPHVLTKLQRTY